MRRMFTKRRILAVMAIIAGLVVLAASVTLYLLQTSWLKQQVRDTIISAAQQATGGRVEVGAFDYHWRSLTAEFKHFIVHGAEPPGDPALFQASSVRIRLRLLSLFRRDVEVALIKIDRPELHVQVARDGTTNLPLSKIHASASQIAQQLFALHVRRFEFQGGLVQVNAQPFPLAVSGNGMSLLLKYEGAQGYSLYVESRRVNFNTNALPAVSGNFKLKAYIQRDRLLVENLALTSGQSTVTARASLRFADPARSLDSSLTAHFSASELAGLANLPGVHSGNLDLTGALRSNVIAGFAFTGRFTGQSLSYSSRWLLLNEATITSQVTASQDEVNFTSLNVEAFGGKIRGNASLKQVGNLQFQGSFGGCNVAEIIALVRGRKLPWNGIANGSFVVSKTYDKRDLSVHATAHIAPLTSGPSVSGEIDVSYKQPGEILSFDNSHLTLPHTQVSFSGIAGKSLQILLDSTNVHDLHPAISVLSPKAAQLELPEVRDSGKLHFAGAISGTIWNPVIVGEIAGSGFEYKNALWREAQAQLRFSNSSVQFSNFIADSDLLHIAGNGRVSLFNWTVQPDSAIRIDAQFQHADLVRLASLWFSWKLPLQTGVASGTLNLTGTVNDPCGSARFTASNIEVYGQDLNTLELDTNFEPNALRIVKGSLRAGSVSLAFSGTYNHLAGSWNVGHFSMKADTNNFPAADLAFIHHLRPGLQAQAEIHVRATLDVTPSQIIPTEVTGNVAVRGITVNSFSYGSVMAHVDTRAKSLHANLSGTLRGARVSGTTQVQLVAGLPATGELLFGPVSFPLLYSLITANSAEHLPLNGSLAGKVSFEGPLQNPERVHGTVQLDELQLSSAVPTTGDIGPRANLIFRNSHPILFDAANGISTIRSFEVNGADTTLSVGGQFSYLRQKSLNLTLRGSADLRILQLFDPNLRSAGQSTIATSITGTVTNPAINGALQLRNGSFSLGDLPMGLSAVNGSVNFNGNRASVENLTAQSGGGEVSLAGFVTYGGGLPVYHLEANAQNVRVRYAGASATATANLRLNGTSDNSILSGPVTVSRISFNPNADAGTLLAFAAARYLAPANEPDFLTGLQLDVHIQSAPDLQVSTALSRDIEGEIDLRLRGTPEHPVLLGSAAINQGDIRVFGTKYSINRGEISFINQEKIEPVLNLDLQTETRGITVGITIAGTVGKLNINYRSDPPLQPRDIIALLTVGRTPDIAADISGSQGRNDVSALQSNANTVLGAAITPSSSRLQKLFGVANVRIDPMVQGITNTMQRLTIEQQISRDITVTYVTNLSQTSEQIFRFEWALSRQYSLVALRDDNGEFGIDIQYKKRFK